MGRNKLVYALTQTTVVIATDLDSGGTWAGATEALKKQLARVAVWTGPGAGPGNGALVDLGASPVDEVSQVFSLDDVGPESEPEQLTLA